MSETGLAILDEAETEERVKKQQAELAALRKELRLLTENSTDLREIFLVEQARYKSIPKMWVFFMCVHLVYALNYWHSVRMNNFAIAPHLFIMHFIIFLLYWRRFYMPPQKYTIYLSITVFTVQYFL